MHRADIVEPGLDFVDVLRQHITALVRPIGGFVLQGHDEVHHVLEVVRALDGWADTAKARPGGGFQAQ